jgi:hypothetical protein
MNDNFNKVDVMKYWVQKVLPQSYDDSLSYQEVLYKVVSKLNSLIENVNNLPDYVEQMIQEYISSGAIADVVHNILSDFMLNVKNPPNNLTPAVGDGSEDDTLAIQGCIDYANENGGKCVYFPSGVYLTQSLTLKDNVSLVGFDRSTTRIVLKGGATKGLINGTINNCTISKLSLDGNMDIQVNNINLIDLDGASDLVLNELSLTDGFNLLKIVATGAISGTLLVFDTAVVDAFVISGNGIVNFDNIMFRKLSTLNGRYVINNSVENAIFTQIYSVATTQKAIYNTANNCVFEGKILNAIDLIEDSGTNTYTNFYLGGGSLQDNIDAEVLARENADTALGLEIDAETLARENADSILQDNIDAEALARTNADTTLGLEIDAEALARANADNVLQDNIDAEALARTNADTSLGLEIDAEALARANADNVLQDNIDAESLARTNADSVLQDNIDAISLGLNNDQINAKSVGATGDGVTDDTVKLQEAIDLTPIGGTLFLPRGTYLVSANLNITKAIKIVGVVGQSVLKIKNNTRIRYIINANNCTNLLVYGVIFDTNMQNTTPYVLADYASGSYNEAIYCLNVYGRIEISFCKFINLYNEYIYMYGSTAFTHIHDNIFTSPIQSQALRLHDIGFQTIGDGDGIIIENNVFNHDAPTNPDYGVCAVTAEGVQCPMSIRNNNVKYAGRTNTYGHRLVVFDLYGNCRNVTIEGNICEKCLWGFCRIESSYNVIVRNNKFYQDSAVILTDPAIWVDSTSVYTQWTHDVRIHGNEFFATTRVTNMIAVWTLNWDRLTSNIEIDDNSFYGYIAQACIKSSCGVSGLYITRNRSFKHNSYTPNALFLVARAFDVEPIGTESSSVFERVEIKNNNWVGIVGAVFIDPSTFTGTLDKVVISNNKFKGVRGAGEGVDIRNCPAVVTNNYLASNAEGVGIRGSKQAYIFNNIIEDCDAGLYTALATLFDQAYNYFDGALIP